MTPGLSRGSYDRACMALRRSKQPDYRGELQAEVMAAVWRLGEATVEETRGELRGPREPAYTTVQTVMNRLVERGLLGRDRRGHAYVYRARVNEADFLARTIGERLAGASPAARQTALLNLLGDLEPEELQEVARYTRRIQRRRAEER